jgi:hypothetical protein
MSLLIADLPASAKATAGPPKPGEGGKVEVILFALR